MEEISSKRTKVFISYSHNDKKYLDRLHAHLAFYERNGMLDVWDDTKLSLGSLWQEEINQALEYAKVAILLVSADFLASKFIADNELPPLLEAAETEGAVIIPVIVSYCAFEDTKIAQFQAVNSPSKPLISMSRDDKEKTWFRVSKSVKEAIYSSSSTVEDPTTKQAKVANYSKRFLYLNGNVLDEHLDQLEIEQKPNSTLFAKFTQLNKTLSKLNAIHILEDINQEIYDTIQPGEIIQVKGLAKLPQWENMTKLLGGISDMSEFMKLIGQNPLADSNTQIAIQGLTSLAALKQQEDMVITVIPRDSPQIKFVTKLNLDHLKCAKEDLKAEVTVLGIVHRRLEKGETVEAFRLLPELGSIENLNRAERRRNKNKLKAPSTSSPVDEIIKYPAVEVYAIAIYQ